MLKLGLAFIAAAVVSGSAGAQKLTWKEMADLPRPVAGYMAGVIDGKLLIIGGSYWENKQKHWSDQVQLFDPLTNSWSRGPALPTPRSDAASATLDHDVYIFGGGSGTEVGKEALVLRQGAWTPVAGAELPEPRLYAVAIASGGFIYVLGGMPKAGDYKTVTTTFWRWRPGAKHWEVLPPLPGPGRISHAMAEIDGSLYCFGGATTGPEDVTNLQDAYRFDPGAKRWTPLPDLGVANRSWWAVGLGDRALLAAGYTNDFARDVFWYTRDGNLLPAGELSHGLADIKFFRIGNVVVGAGGEAGPGVRGKWTLEAELPQPVGRKNRH